MYTVPRDLNTWTKFVKLQSQRVLDIRDCSDFPTRNGRR